MMIKKQVKQSTKMVECNSYIAMDAMPELKIIVVTSVILCLNNCILKQKYYMAKTFHLTLMLNLYSC